MAQDKTIDQLTAATGVDGTEKIPFSKSDADGHLTAAQLSDLASRRKMPIVQQTEASVTIHPDTCNVWGEVASLTIDLADGEDGYLHEYVIWFTSGATATTLSLPSNISFNAELTIEANTRYEISIVNGGALAIGYPLSTETA